MKLFYIIKMKQAEKKSNILFAISNKVFIFAPHKITKDNENNVSKYILVVAPVTTPTVVREPVLVCIYLIKDIEI